jgi:hypothetical protein
MHFSTLEVGSGFIDGTGDRPVGLGPRSIAGAGLPGLIARVRRPSGLVATVAEECLNVYGALAREFAAATSISGKP